MLAPRARSKSHDSRVCVGMGLIALDVIFDSLPNTSPIAVAGGSCGNVTAILGFLGFRSYPIARLGRDSTSERIIEDLSAVGVDTRGVVRDPLAESPIIIERLFKSPAGTPGHRFEWRCPVCGSWFPRFRPPTVGSIENLDKELRSPTVFYFDRPSRAAIEIAHLLKKKALVFFEPSTTSHKGLFRKACQLADVVKYSHERLGGVPELENIPRDALIVETLGGAGLRFSPAGTGRTRRAWIELAALPASEFRDAAGAGDWCSAGFILEITRHLDSKRALRSPRAVSSGLEFGQALAALNCSYLGARGVMYQLTPKDIVLQARKIVKTKDARGRESQRGTKSAVQDVSKFCPTCVARK